MVSMRPFQPALDAGMGSSVISDILLRSSLSNFVHGEKSVRIFVDCLFRCACKVADFLYSGGLYPIALSVSAVTCGPIRRPDKQRFRALAVPGTVR